MADDLHERIRLRAYQLWEDEGRPDGADLKHWLQALDELSGDDEHETLQDLIDEDDRDDEEVRSGNADENVQTAVTLSTDPMPDVEITTGKKPVRQQVKRTEGP
jgi:hypothetical protein